MHQSRFRFGFLKGGFEWPSKHLRPLRFQRSLSGSLPASSHSKLRWGSDVQKSMTVAHKETQWSLPCCSSSSLRVSLGQGQDVQSQEYKNSLSLPGWEGERTELYSNALGGPGCLCQSWALLFGYQARPRINPSLLVRMDCTAPWTRYIPGLKCVTGLQAQKVPVGERPYCSVVEHRLGLQKAPGSNPSISIQRFSVEGDVKVWGMLENYCQLFLNQDGLKVGFWLRQLHMWIEGHNPAVKHVLDMRKVESTASPVKGFQADGSVKDHF